METPEPLDAPDHETLAALRAEVSRLQARITALEQAAAPTTAPSPAANERAATPAVGEELLAAISATLAAYLGVEPVLRQVTLIGGASWAQQGRVTIQASHALAVRHGQE
jgi:methylmalonyl-CoA carboxyltransferase large subunit